MASRVALCRIRLKDSAYSSTRPLSIYDQHNIGPETRLQWTKSILETFCSQADSHRTGNIRDWDFILYMDGSVTNAAENNLAPQAAYTDERRYPARYQLPAAISDRLTGRDKIHRQELFAIGCLLYEANAFKRLFHRKGATKVQSLYNDGKFPGDVWDMEAATSILCCWCPEFQSELHGTLFQQLGQQIQNHPIRCTLQAVGTLTAIAAGVAIPVLGAVGFSAIGPVAGSAAAAWQAGIGAVQAGSVFAWCQSAAMGGAAVAGIVATGVSGAGVVAGATALQLLDSSNDVSGQVLKEKFSRAWSRASSL